MRKTSAMNTVLCTAILAVVLPGAAGAQVRDTRPPTPPPPPQQQARDIAKPAAGKGTWSGIVVTDEQTPQPIKRHGRDPVPDLRADSFRRAQTRTASTASPTFPPASIWRWRSRTS